MSSPQQKATKRNPGIKNQMHKICELEKNIHFFEYFKE